MPAELDATRFDARYYRRFYGSARTRIHGPKEVARLGAMLTATIAYYGGKLRTVLEVGAGVGLLRDWFHESHPKVRYTSTEVSAYAARTYGHAQRDITTWRAPRAFDLVICQGVLPYLDDAGAKAAMESLVAMTGGFLYVEAITKKDYETVCDQERTDPGMRLRPATFYRRRLGQKLVALGGGLYHRKDGALVFWELETG